MRLAAALLAALASCSAPGTWSPGPSPLPSAAEAQKEAERLAPIVARILGTEPRSMRVIVDPQFRWIAATQGRRITLGPRSANQVSLTLAHELAHAFLDESLRDLPDGVEEGVAEWVAAIATNQVRFGSDPHPADLVEALTISQSELAFMEKERQMRIRGAAMWLAGQLVPYDFERGEPLPRRRGEPGWSEGRRTIEVHGLGDARSSPR